MIKEPITYGLECQMMLYYRIKETLHYNHKDLILEADLETTYQTNIQNDNQNIDTKIKNLINIVNNLVNAFTQYIANAISTVLQGNLRVKVGGGGGQPRLEGRDAVSNVRIGPPRNNQE